MSKSPGGKIKYLLVFILLLFIVAPKYSLSYGAADATILFSSDTAKVSSPDTSVKSGIVVKDTVKQNSAPQPKSDSILDVHRTLKAEELIRGERIFYGLAYGKSESVDCSSCHNTRESDSLNWNPDAYQISIKYLDKTARDLSRALLSPTGEKMAEVHKGVHLSPEDIVMVKGYMDEFTGIGIKPNKPVITNLFLFIVASILLLFAITDLIITKRIKKSWINYLILTFAGIFITYTLVINGLAVGRSKDYSPLQPVKFSHAVHAGQNQTDCIYCHSSAPLSKTAGIPSVNVCMNCHLMVRKGTRSGQFEIAKVVSAYENQKPIEWIKVHNLPDHVFFSHAQHVSAGKVQCTECHGDVKQMNVIKQVSDMSMGWCLDCHRTKKLDVKNNQFYSQYRALAEKMNKGVIDSATIAMVGGRDCMKCHY
jgi:hypothetical protein